MAKSSVVHATFVVERTFNASPAEVFNAFADPKAKAQWFVGPKEWESGPREFDFRVGGRELNSGGPKGGPLHSFECIYQDIVPIGASSTPMTCISTETGSRFRWQRSRSRLPARERASS
jgi:hypothetical protein